MHSLLKEFGETEPETALQNHMTSYNISKKSRNSPKLANDELALEFSRLK